GIQSDSARLTVYRLLPDSFPTVSVLFKAETASGNPVFSLKKDQITVTENGSPALITRFRPISQAEGVNIMLVLDHSGSMQSDEKWRTWAESVPDSLIRIDSMTTRAWSGGEIDSDVKIAVRVLPEPPFEYHPPIWHARQGALSFLKTLTPGLDKAGVVGFDDTPDIVRKPSVNYGNAIHAIGQMEPTGGTAIYDGVNAALRQLENEKGIRAIILLTDGEDNSSRISLNKLINRAQKANVPVYVIGLGDVNKRVLRKLAEKTGGEAFFTEDSKQVKRIYKKISEQILSVYELSYISPGLNSADTSRQTVLTFRLGDDSLFAALPSYLLPQAVQQRLKEKERELAALQVADKVVENKTESSATAWYWGSAAILVAAGATTLILKGKGKKTKTEQTSGLLSVYPNPASGPIVINYSATPAEGLSTISVINSLSQPVLTNEIDFSGTHQLDVSALPTGNYFVQLSGTAGTSVLPLIVQH
ncbi:MAG: VWA domain-containing protein, partial [Bacteroidia bacterium]